mgnify:CR=1 FL=1
MYVIIIPVELPLPLLVLAYLWLLRRRRHWLAGPLPAGLRPLATLGRWSLSFYMVHQPVLIGALMAVQFVR